jgi:uncharacterized protein
MGEMISAAAARRIALGAQGFGGAKPTGKIDRRHGRKLFDQIGLIQVDSVNVLVRSQELPIFARLGAHSRDLLPSMIRSNELFEYWGHEASLLPVELHHLFRWKMTPDSRKWQSVAQLAKDHPGYVDSVLAEVADHGPLAAGELSDSGGPKQGSWWDWSKGKVALEYLFWTGQITSRRRPHNFEREYALPHVFIPAEELARPAPSEHDAKKELLVRSARHHGVGTAKDLCDYYRLNFTQSKPMLAELVEDGRLLPATVEGWKDPAYLHPDAKTPRRMETAALLSPFDPVVWYRDRAERMFDFHYRIEIYTPAPKRIYGYYVLPFLLDDRIVARVDLKADRHAGALLAHGVFSEPACDPLETVDALRRELMAMAAWLGLDRVEVGRNGDLASLLKKSLP